MGAFFQAQVVFHVKYKSWLSLSLNQFEFEAKLKPHTVMMTMDSLSVIKSLLTTEIGHRVIRQELPGLTLAQQAINTIPSKKQEDPTVRIPIQTLKSQKTGSRRNKIVVNITTEQYGWAQFQSGPAWRGYSAQ